MLLYIRRDIVSRTKRKKTATMNIKDLFRIAWAHRHDLRSLPYSIYFNLHYLPLKTAIRLPILLYKPRLLSLKGQVMIEGRLKYGQVRLGFPTVSLYPNSGIMFENHGGKVVFKGACTVGNNSALSIGSKGRIEFGDGFSSSSLRITSYDSITFGNNVRIGWDSLVMDTDFHKLTKLCGGYTSGHGAITIGSDCWLGNGCRIMKRTKIPDHCVVSAGTTLSGPVDVPRYSVIGIKLDVVVKGTGMWRNVDDDVIEY